MPSLEDLYTPLGKQEVSEKHPFYISRSLSDAVSETGGDYKNGNARKRRLGPRFINTQFGCPVYAYDWAEQHYAQVYSREWQPHNIAMDEDILLWSDASGLTHGERTLFIENLGLFSAVHSLVANNLVLAIYQHISCHECRQYMLRQAFEEALHLQSCRYIVDMLDLECDEVFYASNSMPDSMRNAEWVQPLTRHLRNPYFESNVTSDSQKLLKELVAFYIIFKGVFFYPRFIQMLAMGQNHQMEGTSRQFKQILQDRYAHIAFGVDVINQIKLDNPALWAPAFKAELAEMIHHAVMMEIGALYSPSLQNNFGVDACKLAEQLKLKANQYCVQIGLPERYDAVNNQFSWMI